MSLDGHSIHPCAEVGTGVASWKKKRQVALSSPNSQNTSSTAKSSPESSRVSSRLLQRKMRMHNNPDIESGSVKTFSTNWAKSPKPQERKIQKVVPKQKPFG
mmetsp:Transcript_21780/g.53831  ORF Transcript_21780/g.53831 Transcript_21780/m.53831 type:complete len:102 (+) Transcript_21780:1114-1419(+)